MKITIVSSCTAKKSMTGGRAADVYLGDQHLRIKRAVELTRAEGHDVAWHIVSAGLGLIHEDDQIDPYDVTFAGLGKAKIASAAQTLGIPRDFADLVTRKADLIVVALGDDYLHAAGWHAELRLGAFTKLYCSSSMAQRQDHPANCARVGVDNNLARKERCGIIGLKGKLVADYMATLEAR